jgi:hypothetical protein
MFLLQNSMLVTDALLDEDFARLVATLMRETAENRNHAQQENNTL